MTQDVISGCLVPFRLHNSALYLSCVWRLVGLAGGWLVGRQQLHFRLLDTFLDI